MAIFTARNTRLVAVLSFVGALLYYQSTEKIQDFENSIQIKEQPQRMDEKVFSDKLEDDFIAQDLQLKLEEIAKDILKESPTSLPPPPARQAPNTPDLKVMSDLGTHNAALYPLLKPSNGSFLDTLKIGGSNEEERKFLEGHLAVLRQRATLLSNECNLRPNLAQHTHINLVWDTKHTPNVVWCPNYKVASTSWMINFLRLAHFNDDNPELMKLSKERRKKMKYTPKYGAKQNEVYKLFPAPSDVEERNRVFNNSLRMIIVRDPISRLISAYRDKMQKKDPKPPEHKFRELQLEIISKYRKENSKKSSPFPTFSEFIQYVIDTAKTLKTRRDWMKNVKCWTPYWAQCNVCSGDFNFVMKLETMAQDQKFLTTVTNMKELKELESQEWRHLHNGTSSNDLMKTYLSQLTKRQALDIIQVYLLDYILFGYNPEHRDLSYTQGY